MNLLVLIISCLVIHAQVELTPLGQAAASMRASCLSPASCVPPVSHLPPAPGTLLAWRPVPSPLSGSACRGGSWAGGPGSARGTPCRRCARTASSPAPGTSCKRATIHGQRGPMWGRSTCAIGTAPGRPQPCAVGITSLNPLIVTRTGLQLKILWDFASSRIEAFPPPPPATSREIHSDAAGRDTAGSCFMPCFPSPGSTWLGNLLSLKLCWLIFACNSC